MSLEYLNGIGASKRKSGGSSSGGGKAKRQNAKRVNQAAAKKYKGALKRIVKAAPTNPVQAARMSKKLLSKYSPLNQMRMKKALKQQTHRQSFEESGEPFNVDLPNDEVQNEVFNEASEEMEGGEMEVNAPEMENTEETQTDSGEDSGEEMGVIYPDGFGGMLSGKRSDKKADKKSKTAKGQKKAAKTDKKKAGAEAKRTKSQAKLERAKQGGGKFKDSFDKALDTAGKFLDKKKGGDQDESETKPSFFEQYKTPLILAGVGLAAAIILPKVLKTKQ